MISIFDIALVTDLIGYYLTRNDNANCALVSKSFHRQFTPSLWRDIRKVKSDRYIDPTLQDPAHQQAFFKNGYLVRNLKLREHQGCFILQFLTSPSFPCRNLVEFDYSLSGMHISSTIFLSVVEILEKNSSLKRISIRGFSNNFSTNAYKRLIQSIPSLNFLTSLSLPDNPVVHCRVYQALLASLPSTLQFLDLRWRINELADPGDILECNWRETYSQFRSISISPSFRGSEEMTIIPFLKRCPNLEIIHLRPSLLLDILGFMEKLQYFPGLVSLSLSRMELHKSNWERVVSALQGRIRTLSLNKVVSRFSESITEHWAETLEVIRIRQLYVPDSHIELILTTCSKLKTFSVATSLNINSNPFEDYGIGLSMSLRNDSIISQVDWVCLELENLELLVLDPRMVIQQTAGNGTLDTSTMEEYTISGIKRVYRQIGRLSKLQHIRLGWWTVMKYETCSNLDMSIESGLGYLEGLKELRVLDIGCIQRVNIGQSEVEWIADNWPRIRKIKGLFFKDSDFSANDDEYEFEKIDGEITIDKYGIEVPTYIEWLRLQCPSIEIS
ncbi:hypothetical protein BGZ49_005958 [Haplosporangium sp. Z 27]|nr:hypothetical protein BGZ49_005958 [Haplosporangium sp. Z 27]